MTDKVNLVFCFNVPNSTTEKGYLPFLTLVGTGVRKFFVI